MGVAQQHKQPPAGGGGALSCGTLAHRAGSVRSSFALSQAVGTFNSSPNLITLMSPDAALAYVAPLCLVGRTRDKSAVSIAFTAGTKYCLTRGHRGYGPIVKTRAGNFLFPVGKFLFQVLPAYAMVFGLT